MKATTLRKKYPEIWNNVYEGVITDLCLCMPFANVQQYKSRNEDSLIARIAYNAAFLACYEVHKKLKRMTELNINEIINS
jgi:hypothetical protein